MKVTCLQTRPMPDFASAIAEAERLAALASDESGMLLLPEYCSGFKVVDGRFAPPAAAEDTNPMLLAMQALAVRSNKSVLLGSIAVPAEDSDKIFNRSYLINASGNIQARYDKIHLFDIQLSDQEVYRESDIVAPGDKLVVAGTPAGPMGLSICYDLRFPHLYRDLAKAGAEILTVPAAFTRSTGAAHWHALCRARAIENGAWVVAPCAVGDIDGGGGSFGHSLIVSPWGEIVADGGDQPGIIEAEIDLDVVKKSRNKIPALTHDRAYDIDDSSALTDVVTSQGQVA